MEGSKLVLGVLGVVAGAGYVAQRRPGWMGASSWSMGAPRVLDCETGEPLPGRPSADLVARAKRRGPHEAIAAQQNHGVWEYVQEEGLDPHWALENGVFAVCVG